MDDVARIERLVEQLAAVEGDRIRYELKTYTSKRNSPEMSDAHDMLRLLDSHRDTLRRQFNAAVLRLTRSSNS